MKSEAPCKICLLVIAVKQEFVPLVFTISKDTSDEGLSLFWGPFGKVILKLGWRSELPKSLCFKLGELLVNLVQRLCKVALTAIHIDIWGLLHLRLNSVHYLGDGLACAFDLKDLKIFRDDIPELSFLLAKHLYDPLSIALKSPGESPALY